MNARSLSISVSSRQSETIYLETSLGISYTAFLSAAYCTRGATGVMVRCTSLLRGVYGRLWRLLHRHQKRTIAAWNKSVKAARYYFK